jgi:undecaprenyl diphosphate synthase
LEKNLAIAQIKNMSLKESINTDNLPKHLAIIMDGNGRWAKQKGLLRTLGHESGTKSVKRIVETCSKLGIENLTLYAFSTENWNRPKLEVDTLMKLLVSSLRKEAKTFQENNIRLNAIGNLSKLPNSIHKELNEVMEKTKNNTRTTLTLALSYGSREELLNVVKNISDKVKNNIISIDTIDESIINQHLYTHNLPDVDLLIRTSGEHRISNFLLWQIAYAELFFTDVLWPDFTEEHLYEAIISYQKRERRFGKTSEQIKQPQ